MSKPLTVGSWPEAFDVCRERNRPLVVKDCGDVVCIFPSGHAVKAPRKLWDVEIVPCPNTGTAE